MKRLATLTARVWFCAATTAALAADGLVTNLAEAAVAR